MHVLLHFQDLFVCSFRKKHSFLFFPFCQSSSVSSPIISMPSLVILSLISFLNGTANLPFHRGHYGHFWTAEFIEACVGLRAADMYANCIKAATPFPLQDFVVDLCECLSAVWKELDGADPRTHAQKLATYHTWMALPLKPSIVWGSPHMLPRYLQLELSTTSKYVP